jgi:hypothetical protein
VTAVSLLSAEWALAAERALAREPYPVSPRAGGYLLLAAAVAEMDVAQVPEW